MTDGGLRMLNAGAAVTGGTKPAPSEIDGGELGLDTRIFGAEDDAEARGDRVEKHLRAVRVELRAALYPAARPAVEAHGPVLRIDVDLRDIVVCEGSEGGRAQGRAIIS